MQAVASPSGQHAAREQDAARASPARVDTWGAGRGARGAAAPGAAGAGRGSENGWKRWREARRPGRWVERPAFVQGEAAQLGGVPGLPQHQGFLGVCEACGARR